MKGCIEESRPKYWDEMTLIEKIEILRDYLSLLMGEIAKFQKLERHTHSMSGRIVYENDEFPPHPYKLPINLQRKPRPLK